MPMRGDLPAVKALLRDHSRCLTSRQKKAAASYDPLGPLSAQFVPLRLRSHRAIIAESDSRYRQVPALPSLQKRIQQYIHFRGSAATAMKGGPRLRVLPGANRSAGGNRPRGHQSLAMEISLDRLTP